MEENQNINPTSTTPPVIPPASSAPSKPKRISRTQIFILVVLFFSHLLPLFFLFLVSTDYNNWAALAGGDPETKGLSIILLMLSTLFLGVTFFPLLVRDYLKESKTKHIWVSLFMIEVIYFLTFIFIVIGIATIPRILYSKQIKEQEVKSKQLDEEIRQLNLNGKLPQQDMNEIQQAIAVRENTIVDNLDVTFYVDTTNKFGVDYAKGAVSQKGAPGGGGLWFAKKIENKWVIVWTGNGLPKCADIAQYNLAQGFLTCY